MSGKKYLSTAKTIGWAQKSVYNANERQKINFLKVHFLTLIRRLNF